jgi:hypothetical protein
MNLDSTGETDTGERVLRHASSSHLQGGSSDGGTVPTGTASATTTPSSGVLSRTSLYTSMAAYNNTKGVEPSEHMRNQLSTPKSIQESTLTEMWRQVSADFHRGTNASSSSTAVRLGRGGGAQSIGTFSNHGARPVTAQDIEETLRHRAITLVGGGFHKKPPKPLASSARRRPKRTTTGKKLIRSSVVVPADVHQSQVMFLRRLHRAWIQHAWEILDGTSAAAVQRRLASLPNQNSLEWIGSRVRIDECGAQPSRIGRVGILVAHTANTWRVVPVPDDFEKPTGTFEKNEGPTTVRLQTFVLPKEATTLSVLLPIKTGSHWEDGAALPPNAAITAICIKLNERRGP